MSIVSQLKAENIPVHSERLVCNLLAHLSIFTSKLYNRENERLNNDGGRLYSRTAIMQNKFIAEPNRILNCDWSLRSTASFE